jgi:hypothetical protein
MTYWLMPPRDHSWVLRVFFWFNPAWISSREMRSPWGIIHPFIGMWEWNAPGHATAWFEVEL